MNTKNDNQSKAIRLFLIITISFSILVEAFIIRTGAMGMTAILMWLPALGALIVKLVYFRKEKGILGFRKCSLKYIGLALLLPLIYIGIPYAIYWMVNPESLTFQPSESFFFLLLFGVPIAMNTALGEEIGWRGFLVPALMKKFGLMKTLLLSSLIWGLWHCPILISGLYMPGTPLWFKLPMFCIIIGAVGFIVGILTLRAKSVWPAALLHAAHNDYDQMLFAPYTVSDNKMFWVSETGILTAVIAVGLAVWMYRSYKKSLNMTP